MPELAKMCIASWHKCMPDWEYKLWNEDNFDVTSVPYVKEAYEARKYAFVTDYVRLWALYNEGGVYMDTDVETLKSYDDLLHLTAFTGYEGSKSCPPVTGTMASEAGGEWVKEQLDDYEGAHFLMSDGTLDMTSNTQRISKIMRDNGFVQDGTYRVYKDLHVFPCEYFCPRLTSGEVVISEKTYCDHHFMGSWNNKKVKGIKGLILCLAGSKMKVRMIKLKRKLFG